MAACEGFAEVGGDAEPVRVTVVLRPAGTGRTGYLTTVTVAGREPVDGHFEPPAPGWDQAYQGAQTAQDGASVGPAITIGTQLFDGLFSGPLRRCWAQAAQEVNGREMHLVIESGSLAIHGLPWELLFDQALAERHLALIDGWSVVRAVPAPPRPRDPVRSVAELSVLVVTSQTGTDPESDFEIITEAWPEASVRLCRPRGTADLAAAVHAQRVDVLHIASSGIELPDGKQYIRLGDPNSIDPMAVVALLSGTELLDALDETRLPGLVVLAGSETEVIAAELAARIPIVLGLRSAVSDVELDPFLREFYPAIRRGASIEHAISAGRTKQRDVTSALGTDWAAPVGYVTVGHRVVEPDLVTEPCDVAPAPTRATVALTGDPVVDQAGILREMSALNLRAMLERWSPVDERLWPDLVVRRLDSLRRDAEGTARGHAAPAAARGDATSSPPVTEIDAPLLPRGVRACQLLEQRRDMLTELNALIERLAERDLLAVAGERWLRDQLDALLAKAHQALAHIAEGTAAELAAVEGVEQPLAAVEWSAAADTIATLEQLGWEQDDLVHAVTVDLHTYQLGFDRYRRELTLASDAGVPVNPGDRQLLTDGEARMREAEASAKQGHIGAVGVTLRTMRAALERRELSDPDAFEQYIGQISASRRAAEERAAVMAHQSELILIAPPEVRSGATPPPLAEFEYGVLLRRPSFEASQEANLHRTMTITAAIRRDFLGTIDQIADIAMTGVRGSPDPAAPPEPAEADPRPTRGISHLPPPTTLADPAEELKLVGKLMYNLLVPNGMQMLLDSAAPRPLTVSSDDLELPWELMHDGTDFLCLRRPFARMPVGRTYPKYQTGWKPQSPDKWNMLLVHSNPYGDLDDSVAEIEEIHKIFNGLDQVNATLLKDDQATGTLLAKHLSKGHYDLIHYAGHAGFDLERPENSFLLLRDKEKFHAETIQNILQGRPVVFLNACDSSRAHNENENTPPNSITVQAQGLASAFIYGGAEACVGALWPIFDDSARAFAVDFYKRLLARQPVGEALRGAREFSRAAHRDRLTWAAYALYGDPRQKLREKAPPSHVPAIVEPARVAQRSPIPHRTGGAGEMTSASVNYHGRSL